jgi:hypothetical protein
MKLPLRKLLPAILLLLSFRSMAMDPPFYNLEASRWADSVLKTLTPDERTAQLFMVAAWSNKDSSHFMEIDSLVWKYKIGGLIFFQGGPVRQAVLTNRFQALSKVPMLIGIDGEWGLVHAAGQHPEVSAADDLVGDETSFADLQNGRSHCPSLQPHGHPYELFAGCRHQQQPAKPCDRQPFIQ